MSSIPINGLTIQNVSANQEVSNSQPDKNMMSEVLPPSSEKVKHQAAPNVKISVNKGPEGGHHQKGLNETLEKQDSVQKGRNFERAKTIAKWTVGIALVTTVGGLTAGLGLIPMLMIGVTIGGGIGVTSAMAHVDDEHHVPSSSSGVGLPVEDDKKKKNKTSGGGGGVHVSVQPKPDQSVADDNEPGAGKSSNSKGIRPANISRQADSNSSISSLTQAGGMIDVRRLV
ncbi:MAG: hypothetical protein WB791_10700 [Waddliaceae bacterium]